MLDQLVEDSRTARFGGRGRSIAATKSELLKMTKQFQSIALTAFIAALSSIEISTAQAKQQCNAAMPSNPHGSWWSYRLIDGRKCWYEGKPGLSKSLLEWPSEASAQPASDEVAISTVPEKPLNPLDSQAWAPNPAPIEPDTFEARWVSIGPRRPPEDAASVTDAGPEVDDRPPLTKADRLPLPYFDSRRAKMTRTLVIIPDQPQPAVGPNKGELARLPTEAKSESNEVTSWHWRVGSKITKRTKAVSEPKTGRAQTNAADSPN